ncbi:MAG: YibE/F family protein [Anaerolineae bacterium]|nr:YibE/F family protein [Anaerolineae bacterium]
MENHSVKSPTRIRALRYLLEGASILLLALLLGALVTLHFTRPPTQYQAQNLTGENTVQARILEIKESHFQDDPEGMAQLYQLLEVEILTPGAYKGRRMTIAYNGVGASERDVTFKVGDRAMVMASTPPGGETAFLVTDHVRLAPLLALVGMLVVVALVIGQWQGARAVLGLALSIALLGGFIIPQILADRDPLLVTLIGIAAVLASTTFLIQGWNPPAHTALLGILASLVVTALLAVLWTWLAHLSGFGSEETLYLHAMGIRLNMRGLLLAGIVIGAGGVLDDVVLAQAVGAFEMSEAAPDLTFRELYRRLMKVGNAHLLTMINTLVLAYASTALPLLIMFSLYPEPGILTLNREMIAQEIVHAVVGSMGVMLAVPLTTVIAARVAKSLQG